MHSIIYARIKRGNDAEPTMCSPVTKPRYKKDREPNLATRAEFGRVFFVTTRQSKGAYEWHSKTPIIIVQASKKIALVLIVWMKEMRPSWSMFTLKMLPCFARKKTCLTKCWWAFYTDESPQIGGALNTVCTADSDVCGEGLAAQVHRFECAWLCDMD